jgi:hypothetical protein
MKALFISFVVGDSEKTSVKMLQLQALEDMNDFWLQCSLQDVSSSTVHPHYCMAHVTSLSLLQLALI